jgi:serine protease
MSPRGRLGRPLPIVLLVAASLGLAACIGAPAPAPAPGPAPAPQSPSPAGPAPAPPAAVAPCGAATTAASTPGSESTIPPEDAGDEARQAVAENGTRTPTGEIPLVTVEHTPAGLEIETTPVADSEQAAAVAETAAADGDLVAVEVDSPVFATDHPPSSDPYRSQQWALTNVAFEHAAAPVAGCPNQVVAVIDTGVQQSHPDLSGRVRTGAVFGPTGSATTDPNGHGTHVAGIVAAGVGNGVGTTGAAANVEILPVKVLDADGSGYSSDVADGIAWAADNGATVINLSLGGSHPSSLQRTAIQYARSNGIVVVAAAGNGGAGGPTNYPAAFEEVIAVAATTSNNIRADFSTTGSYVDLAAPGSQILSTYPASTYKTLSGTSMATPYVAAAAALVLSAHPEYSTPQEVCTQLVRTALDRGAPGTDVEYGHGLIRPDFAGGATVLSGPSCV